MLTVVHIAVDFAAVAACAAAGLAAVAADPGFTACFAAAAGFAAAGEFAAASCCC